jgi:prepilin-type N-terminal cleavage/methylation domain-containing protein
LKPIHRRNGFTLVEVLVVLILLGLTSALVLPKFPAIYERFKSRGEQDAFFQSLGVLSLKAYTGQKNIILDQSSATQLLELPSGWTLQIPKPIVYKSNGVCLGGELTYSAKGIDTRIKLVPPHCEATRI